jgi:hypothetical protein
MKECTKGPALSKPAARVAASVTSSERAPARIGVAASCPATPQEAHHVHHVDDRLDKLVAEFVT